MPTGDLQSWLAIRDRLAAIPAIQSTELLAIAVQHETDHLDGVVFVDHLSALKRELIKKRMKRYKEAQAEEAASA